MPTTPTIQRHFLVESTLFEDCPSCGDEREFEQPPCVDGHGSDCPEWSCIDCGHAIVVDFDPPIEVEETVRWAA